MQVQNTFYYWAFSALAFWGACRNAEKSPDALKDTQVQLVEKDSTGMVKTKKTIVFFGNSLTAGYGLEEEQSFPSVIQKRIDSLRMPFVVVNAGLSGETSAGGNSRIDWVLKQDMDLFVLELGANDALRGLDAKATLENLRGILTKVRVKHPDIPLIVAGMLAPPNLGLDYMRIFEQNYQTLAKEFNAGLIPFLLANVAAVPSLNQPDGIHPTAEGAKIVAENVWAELKKYL